MAKQMVFEADARDAIRSGVEKLAKAVTSTLGPRGRSAVLDKGWGAPTITKDGVSVAEEIQLQDPYEQMGAQLVKEVASKTSDVAGDGTTTATLLTESIFNMGLRAITAGAAPARLVAALQQGCEVTVKELSRVSKPVNGTEEVRQVGTISANNDPRVGKIIGNAMDKVGKDGVITVEEGKTMETEVTVVEGMQFDRGFISPHFVTNPNSMEVEFEKPLILVYEDKISNVQKLLPLLEVIKDSGKKLLIVAEDVESEALATLVVNKLRGIVQCCAVKAPGYGDRRKAMLEDIAILTGAKPIMKDLGDRARQGHHARPGNGPARGRHQRQHDHRRRRGFARQRGRPRGPDPRADRRDHVGLRPREAPGAAGQADRRHRADQRRRRDRHRGQGAQGPDRGRAALDPRRGRGRHPARRRGGPAARPREAAGAQEGRRRRLRHGHRRALRGPGAPDREDRRERGPRRRGRRPPRAAREESRPGASTP